MNTIEKFVSKTWKGNQIGTVVISIPKELASCYDINTKSHILLEKQSNGILIKKLVI